MDEEKEKKERIITDPDGSYTGTPENPHEHLSF